jgi:hypothetical protein
VNSANSVNSVNSMESAKSINSGSSSRSVNSAGSVNDPGNARVRLKFMKRCLDCYFFFFSVSSDSLVFVFGSFPSIR